MDTSSSVASANAPKFGWSPEMKEEEVLSARFKAPSSRSELEKLSKKTFADSTERKIDWAMELFRQWRYVRMNRNVVKREVQSCDINAIGVNKSDLSFCLCAFLNEIKRVDRKEYSAKSLYGIVIIVFFGEEGAHVQVGRW